MDAPIDAVEPMVLTFPTEAGPETDGTARWASTTMLLVRVTAAGAFGLGYSYITAAAASVVSRVLAPTIAGHSALAIPELATRMNRAVRNHGRSGIAACAIAAVDIALWDLKARLLGTSVSDLLGPARGDVPVYASGGFTSSSLAELDREIGSYLDAGYRRVKIKIGQPVATALERARFVRDLCGRDIEVMVDGNGAFTRKEAARLVHAFDEIGVHYFEEPVSSDDLAGLHGLRASSLLDIAAGEYSYLPVDTLRLLETGAVDIVQADATRCMGFTGFLQADALCDAYEVPLSSHCAPALHAHVGRAARRLAHVEHFYDHVRIERMMFDGAPTLADGKLTCDWSRPGLGLEVSWADATRFAA